jgi:hypothetical protein
VDLRHGLNMTVGLIESDRPWGAAPVNFRVAADCAPGRKCLNVSASSARAAVLMAVGRLISWIVLLGVPAICMTVAVLALTGRVDLDPMWVIFSLLLGAVFLHGAQCVRWDELKR